MTPQEEFVTRLRRHRQRCRISLDEMAAETRVKRELLEALEDNNLEYWPRGLYARAWIRSYAAAVGLDPGDTVDEFCRLFPHGDRRANTTILGIADIIAVPRDYRDEFAHREDTRAVSTKAPAPARPWHAPVTQGFKSAWQRVVTATGPYFRARRAPRTTL